MSANLILAFGKSVPFEDVLERTRTALQRLLKLDSVPPIIAVLPPKPSGTATTLEGSIVGAKFPGAYIRFEGDDSSTVRLHVFEGGRAGTELMVGIGTVSTPASWILAAAVATATARLMGVPTIGDYSATWMPKDDSTPDELIVALSLDMPQSDFRKAIELASRKLAIHLPPQDTDS